MEPGLCNRSNKRASIYQRTGPNLRGSIRFRLQRSTGREKRPDKIDLSGLSFLDNTQHLEGQAASHLDDAGA